MEPCEVCGMTTGVRAFGTDHTPLCREHYAQAEQNVAAAEAGDDEKIVTTLRISKALLRRIDQRAKWLGVSRTAYILMAVAKAAESGL